MAQFKTWETRASMQMNQSIAKIAIIFCFVGFFAGFTPVAAQERFEPLDPLQPFNMTAFYKVSWGGLDVGKLVIHAEEDKDSYRLESVVASTGLARVFTKHESINRVHGTKRGGQYLPRKFETNFKLRGKTRHIILTYNHEGELIEEYNVPAENRNKRPEVPLELKRNVMDVLTTLFHQRGEIYKTLKNDRPGFTMRAYDGRRLADINVAVKGRKRVEWRGETRDVIAFSITRTPIAGHKDSELEEFKTKRDPNIEFYLSDDGALTPLKIIIETEAGTFYANYDHACQTFSACIKQL